MPIFPFDVRNFGVILGKTFGVVALFMLVLASIFLVREEYVLHYWNKADGIVVDSRVLKSRSFDDVVTCGLIENISFSSADKNISSEIGGNLYTSDCPKIFQEAALVVNSHVEVLYDPDNPQSFHVKDAVSGDFFFNSYLFGVLAMSFGLVALIAYRIGKWFQRRIASPGISAT